MIYDIKTDLRHRGDSPAKKLVRLEFWQQVRRRLGETRFEKGPHLVLLSKEAGDVSVLLGLGAHPDGIFGLDLDPHAVAAARFRFPEEDGFHLERLDAEMALQWDELDEAMKHNGGKLASALIDMCAPIRANTMGWIFEIAMKTRYFGYEFLVCREKGWVAELLPDIKKEHPDFSASKVRAELLKIMESSFNIDHAWDYVSATLNRQGLPMCLVAGGFNTAKVDGGWTSIRATWQEVYEKTEELRRKGWDANLCLNTNTRIIAAWKAHVTRGTYDGRG